MICRLCLITLNLENSVPLFNEFDSGDAPQLLTIIEKYLHLLITWDDEISTNICSKCSQHLHEFDKYCVFVREQQMKLSQETPIAVEQNVDSRKKRIKRELDKDKMAEKIQVQCEPDENVKLKEHIKCEIDEDIFLKEIQNQSEPDEEPDEIVTNKLNPQCEPDEQIEPREIQIKCEPEKAVVQEIDLQLDPQSVIKSSATSSRSDYTRFYGMTSHHAIVLEKIANGAYTLAPKPTGRSLIWTVLSEILKADGTIVDGLVYCRKCGILLKYCCNQTTNLSKHKCCQAVKHPHVLPAVSVLPYTKVPMTPAERSRKYRARKREKERNQNRCEWK